MTGAIPASTRNRQPSSSLQLVAIAASAGGIAALREVLSGLPGDFGAAVLIVQHLDPKHRSVIADIMSRHTKLEVRQAQDHDIIERGVVLIAPPNRHLLVSTKKRVHLADTELVHFVRPSADLLFESAAAIFKDRTICVVLTGTGSDGAMGVAAIKRMGGIVLAQDEATSQFFGMPGAAVATGDVDYVLPLDQIAGRLQELVARDGE